MIKRLASQINSRTGSDVARNAAWAFLSDIGQLVITFGTFIVLARELGPKSLGFYGAAISVAAFIGAFANVGAHRVLVQKVATGADFQREWGIRTTLLISCSIVATLLLVALQQLILPDIKAWTFFLLVVNQMILFTLTELCVAFAQARKALDVCASMRAVTGVLRLAALLAFVVVGDQSLDQWAVYAAASGIIAVLVAWWQMWLEFGIVPKRVDPSWSDVKEGLPFAAGLGAIGILDSVDRVMLVRYGFKTEAGQYTAGFRIAAFGIIPIEALVRATDADMFQRGAQGAHRAVTLLRKLVLPAAGVAFAVAVAMFLAAPIVPLIVGSEYKESVEVIRWLAFLPLVRVNQIFPSNAIIASGNPFRSVRLLFVAAATNVGLNIYMIPHHGWRGALISTYVAEILYAGMLWVTALRMGREATSIRGDVSLAGGAA